MTTITELEQLAKAATQNTWAYGSQKCGCGHPACNKWHLNMAGANGGIEESDVMYISAANPETILSLLAILKEMGEVLDGISRGVDWNKGTHAQIYRPKLLAALAKYKEMMK